MTARVLLLCLLAWLAGGCRHGSCVPASASRIAVKTRSGVHGMSMCRTPASPKASTSAFITAGSAPAHPASPQPFTPSALVRAGTGWLWNANGGVSLACGSA